MFVEFPEEFKRALQVGTGTVEAQHIMDVEPIYKYPADSRIAAAQRREAIYQIQIKRDLSTAEASELDLLDEVINGVEGSTVTDRLARVVEE